MHLKTDRIADYLAAHEDVWPDLLDALRAAGWANYSLHLDAESGLVVGYVETEDFDEATAMIAATSVNTRWQRAMAEYFVAGRPDERLTTLDEYFHLP